MLSYKKRLDTVTAQRGNLCVGVDPHPHLIEAWGQPVTAAGMEKVARGLVEAIGDQVAVFKPQSAFFEAFGHLGIKVLESVIDDIHQAGALCLLDAKRGDIGSSNQAYAQSYLAVDAPLNADALTVNPFLGFGALQPFLDLAAANGKGLYMLCRTSNPQGTDVQTAHTEEGKTVAQYVVDNAQIFNAEHQDCVGLVIGGTHQELDVDITGFSGSILVPGIGAQGATVADLHRLFGDRSVLPTTSRAIMAAGPETAPIRAAVSDLLAQMQG